MNRLLVTLVALSLALIFGCQNEQQPDAHKTTADSGYVPLDSMDGGANPAYPTGGSAYDTTEGTTDPAPYGSGAYDAGSTTTYTATDPVVQEQNLAPADSSHGASGGGRAHTVAKGDTLYKLARQYYGNQSRWKDIYNANRGTIANPNQLKVGTRLTIP